MSGSIYAFPAENPLDPVWIVEARMFVGTSTTSYTEVAAWEYDPNAQPEITVPLHAYIDSTHFADGTKQRVLVTYIDNYGRSYSKDTEDVSVRNQALIGNHTFYNIFPPFTHIDGSQSYDEVEDAFAAVVSSADVGKYFIRRQIGTLFNLDNWQTSIPGSNFIWVATHGVPDYYDAEDSEASGYRMSDGPVGDSDSHEALLFPYFNFAGTLTLPPFNTNGSPPVNFMFVDGCKTLSSDFSKVLYPMQNRYFGSVTSKNMAVSGWNQTMKTTDCEEVATVLMGHLTAGWPVIKALANSVYDWRDSGMENLAGDPVNGGMLMTYGDNYAKVAGVYTGNAIQTLDWHRR